MDEEQELTKQDCDRILRTIQEISIEKVKYKSAALEYIMTSMYEDFLNIKERLDRIEHKQQELEKLIGRLDK